MEELTQPWQGHRSSRRIHLHSHICPRAVRAARLATFRSLCFGARSQRRRGPRRPRTIHQLGDTRTDLFCSLRYPFYPVVWQRHGNLGGARQHPATVCAQPGWGHAAAPAVTDVSLNADKLDWDGRQRSLVGMYASQWQVRHWSKDAHQGEYVVPDLDLRAAQHVVRSKNSLANVARTRRFEDVACPVPVQQKHVVSRLSTILIAGGHIHVADVAAERRRRCAGVQTQLSTSSRAPFCHVAGSAVRLAPASVSARALSSCPYDVG